MDQVWVCDFEGLVVDIYIGKESPNDWQLWTKLENWNDMCKAMNKVNPGGDPGRFQPLKIEELK